jgi:hypothetical protein
MSSSTPPGGLQLFWQRGNEWGHVPLMRFVYTDALVFMYSIPLLIIVRNGLHRLAGVVYYSTPHMFTSTT